MSSNLFIKRKRPSGSPNTNGTAASAKVEEEHSTEIIRPSKVKEKGHGSQGITNNLKDLLYTTTGRASTMEYDVATAEASYDPTDSTTKGKSSLQRQDATLDVTYRGTKNYTKFIEHGDTLRANAGSHKNRIAGPVKAASNLRVTARFDYAPDLCKDYLETGFCGFGDSCKFLHDRGEYKAGWELDKEWEEQGSFQEEDANKYVVEVAEVERTECIVCDKPFVKPVKTRCGHKFCESCILKTFKRSQKCPECKQPINGQLTIVK